MVRIKKAGLLLGVVMLSGNLTMVSFAAGLSEDRVSSFSSRFGYEWEDEEDPEEDAGRGPGVYADTGKNTLKEGAGPGIEEVTMGEQYHEEFGLYEHSIEDKYFLYSNVSNGGITDQPVYLEIPAGLGYTAEKDGLPFQYFSGQKVSGRGTYVIRITAVEDPNVPLAEQKEYRTVFRFRIDEKLPETQSGSGQGGSLPGLPENMGLLPEIPDEEETSPAETEEAVTMPEEPETEAVETEPAETEKAREEQTEEAVPAAAKTSRSQVFLPDESMYRVTLENGYTFLINIPEGMAATQSVRLEADGTCQLFRGDEELEREGGQEQELRDFGSYRLVSGEYEFDFVITDTYVNWDTYTAPVGMRITEALFNNESMDTGNGALISMTQDGEYDFTLEGGAGERFTVNVERDTQPPEVTVETGRQSAVITYAAEDIAGITLSRNGGAPQEFNATVVDSPGRYVLSVTDRAGNETLREFSLKYHMNFYGLAVIIFCVAVIVAAAVVLVRKKKNLTVR